MDPYLLYHKPSLGMLTVWCMWEESASLLGSLCRPTFLAVNIQKEAVVASIVQSSVNTVIISKYSKKKALLVSNLTCMGKVLPISCGSKALILVMALLMPTIHIHSGLHSLSTSSAPYTVGKGHLTAG